MEIFSQKIGIEKIKKNNKLKLFFKKTRKYFKTAKEKKREKNLVKQ